MVSLILFTVLVSGVAALSNTTPPPSYPTDQAAIAFGATSPAKRGLLERLAIKLDKRQAVQTCGYIDNDTDLPLTCGYASTCSADLAAGLAGCCQGNQQPCPMATSCIPWVSLALCDGNCIADPGLLKCNNPSYPDCATVMLDASGKALRTFSCAIGGFGGLYSASWAATTAGAGSLPTASPGASPASSAKNPSQTGGSSTATGGDSVGGDGSIGGGVGGNHFGDGATVIYNQLAGATRPSLVLVGGGLIVVISFMLLM